MTSAISEHKKGVFYAIICYGTWGFFPLYWKLLQHVPPVEILCHRMFWSMVFMTTLFVGIRRYPVRRHVRSARQYLLLLLTGALLAANWGIYIWAINNGHIVQSSLGYYINPLLNVLFGFLFLGERLNRWQCVSLLLAVAGVSYLTLDFGSFPLISILLALTFALYGLIRKKTDIDATSALTVETFYMSFPALAYLIITFVRGNNALNDFHLPTALLLALGGVVTALPLLWFGKAAERIPLSTMGFIQYLSPSLQLLIGVSVFGEPFTTSHVICFSCIWIGLIIFSVDAVVRSRKRSG
ncbi:MAG: EamA family transporter RarD [Bacteroidales bacterium]|nr:EamA family transporter RarD [Bacteroidales bacterium]